MAKIVEVPGLGRVEFPADMPDAQIAQELERILAQGVPNPQRQEGAQATTLERGALTALQGPTFGFLDELAGAISAPVRALRDDIPLGQAYREGRDVVRGKVGSFMEERPLTGTALQIGASLPLNPMSAARSVGAQILGRAPTAVSAVQPVSTLGRVGRATGEGAAYGTVGGIGASEAETLPELFTDAARSAVLGAGISGGGQTVAAAASPIVRQATTRISPAAAGSYAQQKVAEALLRDVPPGLEGSALTRAQARFRTMGPEARIADVGGQNTRRLLDVTAITPGRTGQATEQAIIQRQAGRAGRLEAAADTALGTQGADVGDVIGNLNTQRAAAARPLYQQVDPLPVVLDEAAVNLLRRSRNLHNDAQNKFLVETGQEIDLSALKPGDTVPFKVLDSLKKSIDDAASAANRAGKGDDVRIFGNLAEELVGKLDDISPKNEAGQSIYKAAREMWAGPSKLIDAAELGAKSMRENVTEISKVMGKMTDSELEAFRVGALQALRDQVGTQAGQTRLMNMWKEPKTQRQLRAIFGNDFRQFSAAVARESRLRPMEAVGRGSQTAARQAGMADLDVSPLASAANVAGAAGVNVPLGGLINAVAPLVGRVSTPEPVRNEIGRILLSRDQQELLNLSNTIRVINEARLRQAQGLGRVGGVTGMQAQ